MVLLWTNPPLVKDLLQFSIGQSVGTDRDEPFVEYAIGIPSLGSPVNQRLMLLVINMFDYQIGGRITSPHQQSCLDDYVSITFASGFARYDFLGERHRACIRYISEVYITAVANESKKKGVKDGSILED